MYESTQFKSRRAAQYANYSKVPFCQTGNLRTIEREGKNSVPIKTRQQTNWSVGLWMDGALNEFKNAENSADSAP